MYLYTGQSNMMSMGVVKLWVDLFPPKHTEIGGTWADDAQKKFVQRDGELYWATPTEHTRYNDSQKPGSLYRNGTVIMHITNSELSKMYNVDPKFVKENRMLQHNEIQRSKEAGAKITEARKRSDKLYKKAVDYKNAMDSSRVNAYVEVCDIKATIEQMRAHIAATEQTLAKYNAKLVENNKRLKIAQQKHATLTKLSSTATNNVVNNTEIKKCETICNDMEYIMVKSRKKMDKLKLRLVLETINRLHLNGSTTEPISRDQVRPTNNFTVTTLGESKRPGAWGSYVRSRRGQRRNNKPKKHYKHIDMENGHDIDCDHCESDTVSYDNQQYESALYESNYDNQQYDSDTSDEHLRNHRHRRSLDSDYEMSDSNYD